MPQGWLSVVGIGNSVITPAVVMRPILLAFISVNHSAPSGPTVMPWGELLAVGIGNSVMACASASCGEKSTVAMIRTNTANNDDLTCTIGQARAVIKTSRWVTRK